MLKCLMYNEEYLSKHFYVDSEGDFWEKEIFRDFWENLTRGELGKNPTPPKGWGDTDVISKGLIGKILDYNDIPDIHWAVENILTRKAHPEYYV